MNVFREIRDLLFPSATAVQLEPVHLPFFTGLVIDLGMAHMSSYTGHLIRLGIALVFVGSYILRPLLMRPVSLIWLRIVESDKPIFALIFGGVSAAVTVIKEFAKHW